jgi:hypothetical protein
VAGAQIKKVTMPRAAQHAILWHGFSERAKPMRAGRGVRNEALVLELDNAEFLPVELDEQWQPLAQPG